MKRLLSILLLLPALAYGQANIIRNLQLQGNANGATNSFTNLTDVVLSSGVRLSTASPSLAALSNGVAAVGLLASNALPANGGDVVVGSLTIATNGLDLTAGQAITFNNGATLIEHPGSGIDFNMPLYGEFIGNAAGLTNLPVYGGAGVTITQTSTGTVAANVYAPFFQTNLVYATNEVRFAIPAARDDCGGIEIIIDSRTTTDDYATMAWIGNGVVGNGVLYSAQLFQGTIGSFAGGVFSNRVYGGEIGLAKSVYTASNSASYSRTEIRDLWSTRPKSWRSHTSLQAGTGQTGEFVTQIYDGTCSIGSTITGIQVRIVDAGLAWTTGTVIRARLMP